LPLPEARPSRAPRSGRSDVGGERWPADRISVLPRPDAIRSLPFLAQYLAQEIIARDETPASLWRAGSSAYRATAAQAEAAPAQLRLDA
jgi:hypothetical protein